MRSVAVVLIFLLAACSSTGGPPPSDAAASTASSAAPSALDATVGQRAWPLGDMEAAPLGYLEYLPAGYGDGESRPLLVFLHGSDEAGDGSEGTVDMVAKTGIPQLIADGKWPSEHPFVVLSPQYGTDRTEGDCDMADDVEAFLAFAIEHYEVDPSRIYLTGISCGAIGVWDYLAAHGDEVVAAAVPISGHAEWALEEAGCEPLADVPVWAFHGAVDDVVPIVHIEGPMEQIRACDGADAVEMEVTTYPDAAHDAWTTTYDLSAGHDMYAWLLEHTND